ncbi:hypothetical protein AVEN_225608-1 [Araneus ventricosus]|uniref:Uncharacterized protein n=1 Tax=Araneus ventricosus TaxID=182803 RepID=A0A4Y2F1Y2_ARAVE|nr:hypothetical protein AVEN_225608-1 [Araneus ventricosus]
MTVVTTVARGLMVRFLGYFLNFPLPRVVISLEWAELDSKPLLSPPEMRELAHYLSDDFPSTCSCPTLMGCACSETITSHLRMKSLAPKRKAFCAL